MQQLMILKHRYFPAMTNAHTRLRLLTWFTLFIMLQLHPTALITRKLLTEAGNTLSDFCSVFRQDCYFFGQGFQSSAGPIIPGQ